MVGEQALEIVLHQRVEHAHDRRHAAQQQDQRAPPPARRAEEIECDPHEAVYGHLGHDAAHQGRDVARSGRVRERQPDVQRHEARLGTGSDERKHQDDRGYRARRRRAADGVERIAAARPGEQSESEQQGKRSEARHEQIEIAGRRVAARAMVSHDQRPRGEGHELPREQERERVVGEHDQIHAGDERGEERQDACGRLFVPAVTETEEARRGAAEIHDQEKERRQGIKPEMRAQPRQPDRQRERRAERIGNEERATGDEEGERRDAERDPVDERGSGAMARHGDRRDARSQQRRDAP